MSLPPEALDALAAAVAPGLELCAAALGSATHDPWSVLKFSVQPGDPAPFAELSDFIAADSYGSLLTFAGGSFLVLFSGKSAYLAGSAFTREAQDSLENLEHREERAVAELSNVLLNPLVGHLAKIAASRLIVSAPKTRIASRRDHLSAALARYGSGNPLAAAADASLASEPLSAECRILVFFEESLAAKLAGKS